MRYCLFILALLGCGAAFAQKENNVWVFGRHIGLNFNSGTPVPFYSAISNADFANGSVCDASGNLLFYTNGKNIWDRNGDTMPNGKDLMHGYNYSYNGYSVSRNSLIIPFPGDANRYYVCYEAFGQSYVGSPTNFTNDSLYYSVVDMRLNGGKGDIVPGQKDIYLTSRLGLALAVVPGTRCNLWLITHEYSAPYFKAFEITPSGIKSGFVGSVVGMGTGLISYSASGMKVSSDTKTLAMANPNNSPGIELYDFDNTTGKVSNCRSLDPTTNTYYVGICFSPDDSRLYVQKPYGYGTYQFDLTQPTLTGIINSMTLITASLNQPVGNEMEVGPDGKIYLSGSSGSGGQYNSMDRIDNPNALGNACNYTPNAVYLGNLFPGPPPAPQEPAYMMYGLPNRVVTMVHDTVRRASDTILCKGVSIKLSAPIGVPAYTYIWQDHQTTDTSFIASQPGDYYVDYHNICKERTDTFHVIGSTLHVNLGNDTTLCDGVSIVLDATNAGATYLWSDGSSGPTIIVDTPGTYGVAAYLKGCSETDFIKIKYSPDFLLDIGNDTTLCGDALYTIQPGVPDATYKWPDGSNADAYTVSQAGTYWVEADKAGCINRDTVDIRYIKLQVNLGNDTTFCTSAQVQLLLAPAMSAEATALWNDGSIEKTFMVHDTGTYWVMATEGPCVAGDTITINNEICDCTVSMPTAFSPNGDGKNDLLRSLVPSGCAIDNYTLFIFNRWGQKVFTTTQPGQGWDGTYNGVPMEIGTYVYLLEFEGGTQKQQYTKKGEIALVR